jgi:hypothetical protein
MAMDYLEDLRHRMPCLDHIHKKTFFSSKVYKKSPDLYVRFIYYEKNDINKT